MSIARKRKVKTFSEWYYSGWIFSYDEYERNWEKGEEGSVGVKPKVPKRKK
tara:strand:- start:3502 stop:3654 length:153 start_codon:yes stop_codon:yes gene_type:complete